MFVTTLGDFPESNASNKKQRDPRILLGEEESRQVPAASLLRMLDTILGGKGSLRNMIDISPEVAAVTKNVPRMGETGTLGKDHARSLRRGQCALGESLDAKSRKRHLRRMVLPPVPLLGVSAIRLRDGLAWRITWPSTSRGCLSSHDTDGAASMGSVVTFSAMARSLGFSIYDRWRIDQIHYRRSRKGWRRGDQTYSH